MTFSVRNLYIFFLVLQSGLSLWSSEQCQSRADQQTTALTSGLQIQSALIVNSDCPYTFTNPFSAENTISRNCQMSKDSNLLFLAGNSESGFYPNAVKYVRGSISLENDSVKEFLTPQPSRRENVRQHFDQLKKIMLDKIKASKNSEALSPMQKLLVQKIEALNVEFMPKLDPDSVSRHRIKCSELGRYPDFRVASIGDSVELSCGAENIPMPAVVLNLAHEIAHTVDLCSMMISPNENSPQLMGRFSHLKIPDDMIGYPFLNKLDCLSRYYQKRNLFTALKNNLSVSQLKNAQESPLCDSVMKEHFADQLGAEILNDYYGRWTPKAEEAASALMYIDRSLCSETRSTNYPVAHERLQSFISQPRIWSSLNCKDQKPVEKLCD